MKNILLIAVAWFGVTLDAAPIIRGKVSTIIVDNFKEGKHTELHYLVNNKGMRKRITNQEAANINDFQPMALEGMNRCANHGDINVAVVIAESQKIKAPKELTKAFAEQRLFGTQANSLASNWRKISFDEIRIQGEAFPATGAIMLNKEYEMKDINLLDQYLNEMTEDAVPKANIDYEKYSRVALLFPSEWLPEGVGGIGTLGCTNFNLGPNGKAISVLWVPYWSVVDDTNEFSDIVIAHEFGHNLGLHHASLILDKKTFIPAIGGSPDLMRDEYGDLHSLMGNRSLGYPAATQMHVLGLLKDWQVETIGETMSLPTRMYALNLPLDKTKAVAVARDPKNFTNNAAIIVEYRPDVERIVFHYEDVGLIPNRFDNHSFMLAVDAEAKVGQSGVMTFEDEAYKLKIEISNVTAESVDVKVIYE